MKYHPNGSVLFVTFSLEQGLLLLSNPLMELLVKNCLAAAVNMHPVTISHFYVAANHIHLVVVVQNPDDVCGFIRYFKTESASRINRILGRKKRTVWCEGYDSPIVLSSLRAFICIAYLYANPAKDNLVESIEEYPGISSWRMFMDKKHSKRWLCVPRDAFKCLSKDSNNLRGYTKDSQRIFAEYMTTQTFEIQPNAWMVAFGISDEREQQNINQSILDRIKKLEDRARSKRQKKKKTVIGLSRLINQKLDVHYCSKRKGKKMWCLSEDRSRRVDFIYFLKKLILTAREVRQKWFLGDYSQPYPLGLYPPSMPKLAEPLIGR